MSKSILTKSETYKLIDYTRYNDVRGTLIEFMDSLRNYCDESGTNIALDERHSSEFVDMFIANKIKQDLQ